MFIDAHCHLERETYGDELDLVVARARAAGVSHLVAVGATRVTLGLREALALAERLDFVYATAGVHPHDAARAGAAELDEVERAMTHAKVVSLGEIGLDYHYDFAPREVQRRVFEHQLAVAKRFDKPVMLHVREAHDDTLRSLDAVGLPQRGGVVHCFTGGPREAEAYLARGMYLSIPGVITFKNAEPLREAVRSVIPRDRLLLETDSPYLAPVPQRGKRNEPAFLVYTAARVAELWGVSVEELGRLCSENTRRLFNL